MHDWRNHRTCNCGEPGCGSYRPFPGGPTARELRAPAIPDRCGDDLGELPSFPVETPLNAADIDAALAKLYPEENQ